MRRRERGATAFDIGRPSAEVESQGHAATRNGGHTPVHARRFEQHDRATWCVYLHHGAATMLGVSCRQTKERHVARVR